MKLDLCRLRRCAAWTRLLTPLALLACSNDSREDTGTPDGGRHTERPSPSVPTDSGRASDADEPSVSHGDPDGSASWSDAGGAPSQHDASTIADAGPGLETPGVQDAALPGDTQVIDSSTSNDASSPVEPPRDLARAVIADPVAERLYIYTLPEMQPLAQLDDVVFADHPGFVPLDDGRVLFAENTSLELIAVQVLGVDEPEIVARAPLAVEAVHLAVDPGQRFAAVSGASAAEGGPGQFTLVDLEDFGSRVVEIATGEPGVLLGGEPLALYHRNDDPPSLEAYPFDALWEEGDASLVDSQIIGTAPHGEALAHAAGKIFAAADDGINVVSVSGTEFGEVDVIPYDVSGRSGGRAYYARLSHDGNYLYSYLRDDGPEHDAVWRDWISDAYVVDVQAQTAQRIEIGNGLVYRLADSAKFALFVQYHPDGDFAHFLDTDPSSDTFQTLVAKLPLETMSKTPTGAEASPWESEAFRIAGMTPSGRYGLVSQGGDGKVVVIDTASMSVIDTIELPSALDYGGYLLGMEPGALTQDTVGR